MRFRCLQAQVRANQISQAAWFFDVVDNHHQVGGKMAAQRHDLFHLLAHRAHQCLDFYCDFSSLWLIDQLDLHPVKGLFLLHSTDMCLGQRLYQYLEPSIRQLEGAHDHGHHAHLVKVFTARVILGRVFLGHQHEQFMTGQCLVYRLDRTGTAHKERNDHVVEHHHIPHRH